MPSPVVGRAIDREARPPDRPTRVRCCPGNEQFRSVWPPRPDPALLSANIRAPIVPEFATGDTPPLAKYHNLGVALLTCGTIKVKVLVPPQRLKNIF